MKKLDKLILSSFFGPFFITFFVVVFILLTQFMLRYFDEIVGKDLGVVVISQLIFYFSINMTTNALPLAVLLSSLMTFGNLGEHFELTALKGSGISLLRIMRPLFLVACLLVVIGFYNNNYIVPKANLEAFSLLYDIKQKKPALDIKEGVFYSGIPGYSIKINKKFEDDETLKDIIIYEHGRNRGNKDLILADSGKMYNILDNRYLVLELFNGESYSEGTSRNRRAVGGKEEANPYLRSEFKKSKMVFSLSEFDLKRTRKDLFSNNRLMKNITQLKTDLDSMVRDYDNMYKEIEQNSTHFFSYHMKTEEEFQTYPQRQIQEGEPKPKKMPFDSGQMDAGREFAMKGDTQIIKARKGDNALTDKKSLTIRELKKENKLIKNRLSVKAKKEEQPLAEPLASSRKTKPKNIVATDSIVPADSNEMAQKETRLSESTAKPDSLRDEADLQAADTTYSAEDSLMLANPYHKIDSMMQTDRVKVPALGQALNQVRYVKGNLSSQNLQMDNMIKQIRKFQIEKYKKLSMAMTILAMFLIGAPLGAIIKRGGLGMPVLLSILFFVLFYVISMLGEKWARQGLMTPIMGVWLANIVLFPAGIFFLKQARKDARLFDADYYRVMWAKIKKKIRPA